MLQLNAEGLLDTSYIGFLNSLQVLDLGKAGQGRAERGGGGRAQEIRGKSLLLI